MEVDPDPPPARDDAVEHGAPERPAALGHPALAVDAERDAADRRAGLEEHGHGVAAVRRVGLRGEALDGLVRVRAVDPLERVRPQAELDVEAERGGLLRGEPERGQVALTLLVGELRDANRVAGHETRNGYAKYRYASVTSRWKL